MAFVGPHHGPNMLGKNHQSTTKVTLNEPPIMENVITDTLDMVLLVRNQL